MPQFPHLYNKSDSSSTFVFLLWGLKEWIHVKCLEQWHIVLVSRSFGVCLFVFRDSVISPKWLWLSISWLSIPQPFTPPWSLIQLLTIGWCWRIQAPMTPNTPQESILCITILPEPEHAPWRKSIAGHCRFWKQRIPTSEEVRNAQSSSSHLIHVSRPWLSLSQLQSICPACAQIPDTLQGGKITNSQTQLIRVCPSSPWSSSQTKTGNVCPGHVPSPWMVLPNANFFLRWWKWSIFVLYDLIATLCYWALETWLVQSRDWILNFISFNVNGHCG